MKLTREYENAVKRGKKKISRFGNSKNENNQLKGEKIDTEIKMSARTTELLHAVQGSNRSTAPKNSKGKKRTKGRKIDRIHTKFKHLPSIIGLNN